MKKHVNLVSLLGLFTMGALLVARCHAEELTLIPHVGEWARQDGGWQTGAAAPSCGWYLRSPRQYDLKSLSFRVSREQEDGFIFIYLKDWQLELSKDKLRARYTAFMGPGKAPYRLWTQYYNTASRGIAFGAAAPHDVTLTLDGERLRVAIDGKEVLAWRSPREEWLEKIRKSGRMRFADRYELPDHFDADALAGKNQIVVLHAYNTPASFSGVAVVGRDAGEAEGFAEVGEPPSPPFVRPDTEFARLVPDAPATPANVLDDAEKAKAAVLPAVESLSFTKETGLVDPAKYFGDKKGRSIKVADYFTGAAEPGKIPSALHRFWKSQMWGAANMPQEARIYFNLKDAGDYTLKLDSGAGMGWGPHELEIRVDGTPVSRELYRAIAKHGLCAPINHWVPLRLAAGPHRIDIALTESLVKVRHGLMGENRFPIHALALEKGTQEPEIKRVAGKPTVEGEKAEALAAPAADAEQAGAVLSYRVAGLAPGQAYTVAMTFYDVDVNRPGDRLMDIAVNGQQVETALDIVKAHGWMTEATRRYPATADAKGEIAFRLKGRNFKAFVNALAVVDSSGKTVWGESCGWTSGLAAYMKRRGTYTPVAANRFITEPLPPAEDSEFDGHNLVLNPHFTLARDDGKPVGWYSGMEMRQKSLKPYKPEVVEKFAPELAAALLREKYEPNPLAFFNILPGEGAYSLDTTRGHEKPGAAMITMTGKDFALVCNWPPVDFNKTQQFSFYVKTDGATGEVFGEILWFISDMSANDFKWRDYTAAGGPLRMPRLQLVGRSASKARLTGTQDWTRIDVTGKPPRGAVFAMLAVRVENNTAGTVWIDDAAFDGYGAEPLEIEMSLLGFHPSSDKEAVIKSLSKEPVRWELRDQAGKTVRSGDAVYKNEEWYSKRHYFTVDFSDLKNPGRYRLTATQGAATASSPEFRLDRDVYRDLARISLNGLHAMRMNQNLPGYHGPEALEDAMLLVPTGDKRFSVYENLYRKERLDTTGGYFDAGDQIKHVEFWPSVIMASCEMWQNFGQSGDMPLAAAALQELRYALDSFLRMQLPDGSFVLNVKPNVQGTDNIPFYSKDRYVESTLAAAQGAGVCAMSAWALRGTDKALAERAAMAAERNYNLNRLWETAANATTERQRLYAASKSLWAETYLSKLDPKNMVYQERMARNAELVAKGLSGGDYRGSGEMYVGYNIPASLLQDPVWVACDFIREYPDSPAVPALRDGLRAFVEEIKKVSAIDPWGQARSLEAPAEGCAMPDRIPGYWALGYWPMLSYSLTRASAALNDPEILRLAERQMQWVLGKNFGGVAAIHGFSDRVTAAGSHYFTRDLFFEDWLKGDKKLYTFDGVVPKTFMRGIAFGYEGWKPGMVYGSELGWQPGDNYCPPFYRIPQGYCATIPQADYPVHPSIAEYGLPLMALHAIPTPLLHAMLERAEK